MSDRPVRNRTISVRLADYDHHVGGRVRSQQGNSQQAGGGVGDQGELDLPPPLAESGHEGDSESDDESEDGDSDDEWGSAINARAGVQRGPAVHERGGAGGGVAGGGGNEAPLQAGVLQDQQGNNIQPLLGQQVVPPPLPPPLPPHDRDPHLGGDGPQANALVQANLDARDLAAAAGVVADEGIASDGRGSEGESGAESDGGGDHGAVPPARDQHREVAGTVGEQALLQDLLDPDVPGPHAGPVAEDTYGWNQIDKLGVWECALCEFPTLLDIPRCYREVWASAVDKVLSAIQEAEGGIQLERGLKWLLILPKAIFRQGRRGGKAGKGLISQRINSLITGVTGALC